jgi:AraC-like DNA-binding protein
MSTVLFNTLDLSLLITIYQSILFAFFLITLKKGDRHRQSNILLALFLLCYAAISLDTLINFGEAFRQFAINHFPNLFYVFGTAYWLEAIFLLFYVRSLIYKEFRFTKKDLLYFVPLFFYIAYELNHWFLLDHQLKIEILKGYHLANEPFYTRFINLFRESFRCYCGILCLLELKNYQQHIKEQYADIDEIDLTWLRILVLGFLAIRIQAILITLGFILSIDMHFNVNYALLGQLSNFIVMFLISFLIFFSMGVSNIFKGIERQNNTDNSTEDQPNFAPEQITSLTKYMVEKKPYLNPLLNLENLANQVQIPQRQLSQIINRHFEKNFFEYINSYRVEEAKSLLIKPENRNTTMLKIMADSGFNSKATFNTFFKKLVGLTPSEFKRQQTLKK